MIFRERSDYNPFPVAYYWLDYFGKRAKKHFGGNISSAMELSRGAYHQGRCRTILGSLKQVRNWRKNLVRKIVKNPRFVRQVYAKSEKIGNDYARFVKQLLSLKEKSVPTSELIDLHKKWIDYYAEYGFWNVIIWFMLGDGLVEYVVAILTNKYKMPFAEQQELLMPIKPSYLFKEETDLLKIGALIDFFKKILSEQSESIKDLFKRHADKWHWIPFDYIGPAVWQAEDFFKRLLSLVKTQEDAEEAIRQKRNHHKKLSRGQKEILAKYHVSAGHKRIIEDLQMITLMQDKKKGICTLAQFALHEIIFTKFAGKLNIRPVDCIKFHHEELWRALKAGKQLDKILPQRLKAMCVIGTKDGISLISGQEAQKIFNKFSEETKISKEIKGQPASMGKAKGRIRVLISNKEIGKMKKGEVLVSPMTTPDFVMAMKKAAAIITDEGGMTSHAAIVSRELGIPCVVGTKIATRVLKDGDLVEVDADRGLVKILERN